MGYIQLQRGKRKEAKDAFRKALEIYESNQTLNIQDEKLFVEMLETVAVYEALDDDLIGAEKKIKRALELNEKINGKDALATLSPLLKLADIYQVKGEYDKAAPLLLRALEVKTKKAASSTTKNQ